MSSGVRGGWSWQWGRRRGRADRSGGLSRRCRAVGLSVVMLVASALGGCSTNPATGQMQFNVLSEQQEIAIGEENAPRFVEQSGGEIPDTAIRDYVAEIGHELAALSERPDLPWEFTVLNSPIVNAFALPGGKVFITREMLSRMTDEAQLAGVLGHEVAHVTAQHGGQRMSQQMVLAGIVIGVSQATEDDIWPILAGTGTQLFGLSFSRSHESEADMLGLRYMTRAGYDPRGLVGVMRILKEASGDANPPEFLSTHPLPDTRINEIEQLIETEYGYTRDNPNFVRNADRFERNVLQRLKNLPPPPDPKKTTTQPDADPDTHTDGNADA